MSGPSGTQYGFGTTGFRQNYGVGQSRVSPLSMQDIAASQKSEFERLGGLQNLQMGQLQQQTAGLQFRESQMQLADLEEERRIRDIINKGPSQMSGPTGQRDIEYQNALRTPFGQKYQLEKEKTQYELDMLRKMQQGGWGGSFSVPSFPSMR